jgi:cytochrome c oxidase assembly protein subunit 15
MLGEEPAKRESAVGVAARGRALGLARGFAALTGVTFCLIVLGALVRAHDAGLACPDWPLCFGEFVPRFDLRVAFEYGHRVLAGSVSLAFAALAALALRLDPRPADLVRHLGIAAAILGVQVLLGALTVWHLLASWTVTSHLLVGNSFAVALAWTAATLREHAEPGRAASRAPSAAARAAIAAGAALLVLQVALGGLVSSRHAGMACPEWPTCNGGLFFPSWRGEVGLHLMHRTNGYLLVFALALAAWLARGCGAAGRLSALASLLVIFQAGVGIANVLLGIPVEITGLHSALAAALVLSVSLALRACLRAGAQRGAAG